MPNIRRPRPRIRGSTIAGTSSYQVTVPANPALLAYSLAAQATTFDGITFASSNGLAAVVGN